MTSAEELTKEARAEGLAQGRAEGEAAILLRQLGRRFGELPAAIVEQVKGATTSELELWADRVLTANSMAEVFAGDDADV